MVCEKMGWTYQELMETPEDFLAALYARWDVENKYQEEENKKLKQKMSIKRKK